jgi:glycosyltransferase involved in cell wall biosynthesis
VLVEYVVWGYLLDRVSDRSIARIVDTHDVLHERCAQFRRYGKPHWIDITAEEESAELARFDMILAIQRDEALVLREMVPDRPVMVVGHSPESVGEAAPVQLTGKRPGNAVILGFAGSRNHANVDGLAWFLRECWPLILERTTGAIELLVGGPLRDSLPEIADSPQVRWLGALGSMDDFYAETDVVINPVRFGSGLKIKTIEAMWHGKPQVVHGHSATGLDDAVQSGLVVAADAEEFAARCVELAKSPALREQQQFRARMIGQKELSASRVYGEFLVWLRQRVAGHATGNRA